MNGQAGDKLKVEASIEKSLSLVDNVDEKSRVSPEIEEKIEVPVIPIDVIDKKSAMSPEVETKTRVPADEEAVLQSPKVEKKAKVILDDVDEKLEVEAKEKVPENDVDENLAISHEQMLEIVEKMEVTVITTDFIDGKSAMSPEVETKTSVPTDSIDIKAVKSPEVETKTKVVKDDIVEKPKVEPVMPENSANGIDKQQLEIIEKMEMPVTTDVIDNKSLISPEVETKVEKVPVMPEKGGDGNSAIPLRELLEVEEKNEVPVILVDVIDEKSIMTTKIETKTDVPAESIDKEAGKSPEIETKSKMILDDVDEKSDVETKEKAPVMPDQKSTIIVGDSPSIKETPEIINKTISKVLLKPNHISDMKIGIYQSIDLPKSDSELVENQTRENCVSSLISRFENWTKKMQVE